MARVRLNGAGVRALLKSSGVVHELDGRMDAVLNTARATAPVDSGAYRDSLRKFTVVHPTRTVVRVGAFVDYAPEVEGDHGTLTRALDASGA